MTFPPIAIIGQGCVLPGALSPQELWKIVREGRSVLSHAPPGLWGVYPGADRDALAKETLNDIGGYVTGFEKVFSPRGFRIPIDPGLDPVFLWTLHAAREALRDAGLDIERKQPRGAVILGNLSYPTPGLIRFAHDVWGGKKPATPENRFNSGLPAALTAQAIGFEGQRFSLDAACASSLYAIALACRQLADGHADLAIAGGVNHVDDLFLHLGFTTLSALSPGGRSRPFHREADGLVPAQGVALVVLKLLSTAMRDGDRIQGVIRGVGLSNDGRSRGLLVPSESGQIRAMRAAYEMSGLSPLEISLVECHATGTTLGDATEIRSMKSVFAGASDVPLGSLKSNLGHLVTASGAAGLLKVLGGMEAQVRPATLHAEKPAAEVESPFRLLHEAEPWLCGGVRRAAVSSFGFGGNNAHMIVEEWSSEYPIWSVPPPQRKPEPIAVVAMAIHAGNLDSTEAFESCLFSRNPHAIPKIESFPLAIDGLRFPPADLADTLPQQTLLLRLAATMQREMESISGRTSIFVGMQCDAEAVRHGLHWRWKDSRAAQTNRRKLNAASTLGCMPNMVANRLNQQFGSEGPGFAVSAEEASGTVALSLAMASLSHGEIEAAVVAAVDLCCEPVQAAAAHLMQPEVGSEPGDAAVMMILKHLDDARQSGDHVLAVLTTPEHSSGDRVPSVRIESGQLAWLFGHPHACSGLLQIAAAISACYRRALLPASGRPSMPWITAASGPRMRVRVAATGGEVTECDVAASSGFSEHSAHDHGFAVFGAESMDQLMAQLASRHSSWSDESSFRVAIVARDAGTLAARRELAMRLLTDDPQVASGPLCDGVWFGRGTLQGEIACVFGGPAGAYAGMGRELLLAFPGLAESLCERAASFRESAAWLYESEPAMGASPEEKLWGSSFLIQAHAELMLRRLDLRPHAAIGYCSGETNALFAFGAWTDLDDFHRELKGSGFYSTTLSGEFQCLRSAWGLEAHETAAFTTLRVAASAERIREALASEPRVHLAIVHSANDAVIAGDPEGCRRVADRVGAARASSLGYDFVMHCPEAKIVADEWRALHRRTTQPVPGVRFYTHATLSSYTLSDDSVADALVGQAMRTIDFPAMIERAWADGVRIFIEHGPHAACTRWIDEILGDRPHLAVALDQPGRSSVLQALESVARLFAAGVPLDPRVLVTDNAEKSPKKAARHEMQISAHAEPVRLAEFPVQIMTPPPRIPSVLPPISFERNSGMGEHCAAPTANDVDALALHHHDLAQLHIAFQRQLAASHMQFVELLSRITVDSAPDLPSEIVPVFAPAPAHRENLLNAGKPGPKLDRRALEAIASGPIAPVLGPLFEEQDGFRRVVRMPEPPLLLVDRVTGIKGTPYSMGQGTIWTETDIAADGWYLHEGRMPAGLVVEAGQADLLLISWLGIDQFNRGERVYRLLGCDLTLFGELPGPGETLAYEITINGHAQQGNVRLFFFQYDCRVNGELRMKVRGGQAGFFTDQELAETGGVLFDPETGPPTANGRVDPAPVTCLKSALSAADIQAFIEGRAHECFGEGFHFTQSHTRTPSIQGGNLRLIDEVLEFDPAGGPWKRGYLRAKLALSAEHWFYKGHFKDDPCMPGTLMLEGSLQAMSIYLAALGFTLDRDGFLFMPAAGNEYKLRCRGQATPRSRELIYEVFVDELIGGTEPILFADLLGTVDGVKAFHCRRMGLKLTAAYPLDRGRIAPPVARSLPADSGAPFVFDLYSLLACAWGRPSEAFGPMYAVYDSGKVVPRLPGPPFHFMSRIVSTEGRMGGGQTGTKVEVEYDIPEDAWYFADNHLEEMPLCALMEVALQPCGWIASFSGVLSGEEFCFRNLDGDGVVHRSVGRRAGVLSTTVHFTSHSRVGNMIIVGFEVEVRSAEGPVFSCETRFGYFTRESMREQAGLPAAEQNEPAPAPWALDAQPTPRVTGKLRMIDEVVSLWPDGGAAKLGRIVARRNVLPDDWYFRAHFYRDPVQPGSLGVEAMLQALQILCEERSRVDGRSVSRIEPLGDRDTRIVWKYRGQVTPNNRDVTVDVIITDIESTADGAIIRAEGSLYVDSKRIYHASGLSARVVTASNELRAARLFALSGDTEYDILAERDRMEARVKAGASLANISTESLDRAGGDFAVACSLIADDRAALMRELGWAAVGIPKAVSTGSPWITPSGSYFAPVPLGSSGKIAFIYPGMGSAMAGAGAKIFRRFTDPVCKLRAATGQADGELCDTVSGADSAVEPLARDAMKVSRASMVLSYLYTQLLRDEYGVSPQMAAGFSVGEGSMFAALSVWPNPALLDRKFADSKLFTERLAGPMISAREHFGIDAGKDFFWRSAIVQGPLDRIRTALSSEPTVSLITIHTPREAMIGGEATACGRVLDALQLPYIDAPFQLAIHCGAARREVKTLRWIHELPVKPHPGVEFYSAVFDQPIDQTSSAIASALAESYTQTVDFPKLIGRLYEDGARIFVEAGGQSNCSHWIGRILQGRPHACAALHSSVLDEEEALLRGLGVLLSHRVKLTLSASNAQFAIKPEAGSSHPDGQDGGVSGGRWQALILRQVADLLGINEPSQIPLDSPIPLDSLSYMQLRSRLEGASGCLIEPDLLRENRTVRRLAAAIEDLTDKTASRREEFQPSQRHAGSWGQLSMWRMPRAISSQLTPLELHRSVPILWVRSRIEFEGPLEVERLSTAILDTFARYDILRSVLRDGAERPEIEVLPGWLPAISVETWSDAAIERFFGLPLEPSAALPARVAIFRKTGDEHEVCLHQHHFFTDGISLSIFWKEVITRYLGAAVPGPGPTFEEYCRSVDRWLESESGRASRSYWRQKLRGAQPTRLPLDYPRTEPADFRGEHVGMRVESGVLAGIDEFCRRESVTRFSVLLWALARSVHQETGQDDVLVSTFQANRALPGFQRAFDVVGPVIEEQVLRCRIDAEKSPGEQLLETHETVTESMAHSSVPVMYLRESGECPIPPTAVSLVYQSFVSPGDLTAGPLKLRLREAIGFGKGHASFELELVLWPVGDELLGVAAFSTQVFRRSTVERILSRFYGALAEVS